MNQLLTVEEVAEIYRVTPYTVRRWLREGSLRGVKVAGGAWRIPREELEKVAQGIAA